MLVTFDISFVCHDQKTTVLSTASEKIFFAWRFIPNENILFLLAISYQKPLMLSFLILRFVF